jgi:hypothetical protein
MHFRWTPPGAPIFFVSLILAVAAVATLYTHVPLVGGLARHLSHSLPRPPLSLRDRSLRVAPR